MLFILLLTSSWSCAPARRTVRRHPADGRAAAVALAGPVTARVRRSAPSAPTDPVGLLEDGVGGGAIAVPLFGMAGGFALSGRGSRRARLAAGLVALVPIPVWALTATSVGGSGLALDAARGAWVALYFWAFLALLALACSIPHRPVGHAECNPETSADWG